jgi:hypothetical protein
MTDSPVTVDIDVSPYRGLRSNSVHGDLDSCQPGTLATPNHAAGFPENGRRRILPGRISHLNDDQGARRRSILAFHAGFDGDSHTFILQRATGNGHR